MYVILQKKIDGKIKLNSGSNDIFYPHYIFESINYFIYRLWLDYKNSGLFNFRFDKIDAIQIINGTKAVANYHLNFCIT